MYLKKWRAKHWGIAPPEFEVEEAAAQAFQAVIPARKEIPSEMRLTVEQVLEALR